MCHQGEGFGWDALGDAHGRRWCHVEVCKYLPIIKENAWGCEAQASVVYTTGVRTCPCIIPATDQEFLFELKYMIDKVQDVEEKKTQQLCLFFISIAMSQQHMIVSSKVTSAGEDNK